MKAPRLVVFVAVGCLGVGTASADDPEALKAQVEAKLKRGLVTRQDIAPAVQEYHEGKRALREGRSSAAMEHFQEADRLAPE
jgi:hypothetical protein